MNSSNIKVENLHNIYNGAKCDSYYWSQSHSDIDVFVDIPSFVTSSKLVNVIINSKSITISICMNGQWIKKIDGNLLHTISCEDSTWTLHSGKYIHVSLEKVVKCWWKELIVSEMQLIVGHKNREMQFSELNDEELKVIEKLTHQQKLKLNKGFSFK
jgi:hypothetical protein